MTDSDDIANLFKHFGGQPDQYREIARSNDAKLSRARWPLLAAVETTAVDAPPVQQHAQAAAHGESPLAARQEPGLRQEPSMFRRPATPAAAPASSHTPVASPIAEPVPDQAVAKPSSASAEFIPPRPRTAARFEFRPPADVAMPFGRMVADTATPAQDERAIAAAHAATHAATSSAFAAQASALSAAAAVVQPMAPPAPAGLPPQSAMAAVPASELQTLFARLVQPANTPPAPDKNASLLQRLRRL